LIINIGYKASEVIGINIYNLMPERFSRDHHIYLTNYLTTGIKKVIGSGGRRVFGLRKDGTEFPLHLTISELKDDDEHLFTGIARDLTEEV
jgi:PAS domain S-box-containing protein